MGHVPSGQHLRLRRVFPEKLGVCVLAHLTRRAKPQHTSEVKVAGTFAGTQPALSRGLGGGHTFHEIEGLFFWGGRGVDQLVSRTKCMFPMRMPNKVSPGAIMSRGERFSAPPGS